MDFKVQVQMDNGVKEYVVLNASSTVAALNAGITQSVTDNPDTGIQFAQVVEFNGGVITL